MRTPIKIRKGRTIRWITVETVRHWRSGKMIRRRDGKPFRFPIFGK